MMFTATLEIFGWISEVARCVLERKTQKQTANSRRKARLCLSYAVAKLGTLRNSPTHVTHRDTPASS